MATWKKLVVSGSNISQLNNDSGYITSAALHDSYATASINGVELIASSPTSSFTFNTASGETAINLTGTAGTDLIEISLADGGIGNDSLQNSSIYISGSTSGAISTIGSVSLGDSGSIAVQYDDSTIGVNGSNQLEVKDNSLTLTKLTADTVVTEAEGIGNNDNDTTIATNAAIIDYVATQIGGANDLTVGADSGQESIDLSDDQIRFVSGSDGTIGADITKASNTGSVALSLNTGSDHFSAGVRGKISVADTTGAAGIDLSYNGSTGEISGSLVNSSITIGAHEVFLGESVTLAETGFNSGSFSGSFEGDGSGLTGIATTLQISGSLPSSITSGSVDLQTQGLTVAGTANEVDVVAAGQTITVGLPNDVIIQNDLTVNGDLVVEGTSSFRHEDTLEIADQFILLNSGSAQQDDGGIVVQQATQDVGDVFGFKNQGGSPSRWGVATDFHASASVFTPDGYVSIALSGTENTSTTIAAAVPDSRYNAAGNIWTETSGDNDIWIYS
jgi:hypothetical protein